MTLIAHAGAEHIDYDGLHTLDMPEPTDTHVPIAQHAVVDMVKYASSVPISVRHPTG